ncbi:protein PHLOEM PROTEIN 2-LIKE A1 [Ziziphus jujuba]|uniref:Protein PHLOEM PROTEIN 2-LIKE A1 n=1 Tax=Ziziphus jujuba TaxID=326968 RepID=A0A6P3Z379_ZIZJJ|nr:protein PHLOEM PROTEIN 2-LIKE A1 [Ziziphus jujuba]
MVMSSPMTSSSHGEFHEFKRKKIWVDKKTGYKCMMLYPRWLDIAWGGHPGYWVWNCYKETSDENIEVAKLAAVCWLQVRGQFKMSELSPGVDYEIAYIIKIKNGASGWELPVTLEINNLSERKVQKRVVSLLEKPRGDWIELNGGSFQTNKEGPRDVWFTLYEHGGHWKKGLIIKGIIIRPKI